ncbi:MAG: hypothetical protein IBX58_17150 [Roseovarius sp.]|nr:hypothetical protein [Roseovarius sp.]
MSVKDPVQQLIDEITLIREDVKRLKRTSLDKDEAEALHQTLVEGVDRMAQTGPQIENTIKNYLLASILKIREETTSAAVSAAEAAIGKTRAETLEAARSLSQAAGEARREAWRWFGGFWVWLASMLATGAVLGLLAAFLIIGRGDAREFGQYPRIYCSSAGGQIVEQDDGSSFCAIWIRQASPVEN